MNRNLVGSILGRSSIKIVHLWWPCLLTDPDEMSTFNREPSIDASYQVSIHLAKRFQRRRFLKIGQSETRIACGYPGELYRLLGASSFNLILFLEVTTTFY
jgi:hypothetical protein